MDVSVIVALLETQPNTANYFGGVICNVHNLKFTPACPVLYLLFENKHFAVIIVTVDKVILFDSLAEPTRYATIKELATNNNRHFTALSAPIQSSTSIACGYFVLAYSYFYATSKEEPAGFVQHFKLQSSFFTDNSKHNDHIVRQLCERQWFPTVKILGR